MNPPSQPAPQTRAFQSWQLVFIAVMLLAAAVTSGLYIATVQAESHGAITGLTLTSDAPGTLAVSWDAASPTPTDYRIDWAESDEDYQSWKVDEGHKYPAPTATAVTITDLEHDTEYKIRMRARYYRGEHEGKSWGGPWATETITVAGEPAETPTPEPTEEEPAETPTPEPVEEEPVKKEPGQRPPRSDPPRDDPAPEDTTPPAGTIDTITAVDNDTGQLLLTWTAPAAPNADPTDYHVNWGKSAEDYPADTAEAGNAHPTGTTHTLAGLEFDTDYNIRVRARYTDGDHAASPWNGPWTETTAQVHQPLPAAPSFINTAVTEGQVLLSWLNPSDDSITGYQILRGPDAANLVVIEDDTGSSSTSYTDTAPPAGQTHTYGVKARNSAGLSPAGTATATVPEVLIVARHESTDNTLVSNLEQTTGFAGAVIGTYEGNQHQTATSFMTGTNPFGYHPTSVQIEMRKFDPDSPTMDVSIRGDNANLPSDTVLASLTTSTALTNSYQLITFTTSDEITLQPNTRYWLHVTATGTRALAAETESDNEDTESQADWSIANTRVTRIGTEPWATVTNSLIILISIRGHAAPAFLVSNLDSPGTQIFFSRDTDTASAKFAQAFSAADNTDGTSAEFDFHAITVLLKSVFSTPKQLAASDMTVTVHGDTGGLPGNLVHTMTAPATYTVRPDSGPVTFSAPPGSILSSDITYWVKFEITADSEFFVEQESIIFEFATDNNEVQGPTTNNRWSIGDDSLWSPETLSWMDDPQSIKMKILGHDISPELSKEIVKLGGNGTLNNNIVSVGYQEVRSGSITPTRYRGYATSFTPGGDGWYYLTSIDFSIQKEDARLIRVAIHEDNSGGPADAALYVAYVDLDVVSEADATPDLTATFPDNATLEAGKTYWAVFDEITGAGIFYLYLAEDSSEDAGFESWAIGDELYDIDYLAATGFTWVAVSEDTTLIRNDEPILMTFHGYAEPERTLVGAHGLRNTDDDGPLLRFGTERITKAWLKLPMGQTFDFCEPTFVAGSGTERSWRLCDLSPSSHHDHEWAGGRGFTTGPNPTGYTITALGVDMDVKEGTLNPVAAIHSTSAFQTTEGSLDPQSPLANYQAQADINGSPDRFAPRTGSEAVHLAPNTTYVAYFENDATGYFETPNARAGQDPGAEDGWTLGYPYGSKFIHPLGFAGEPWNLGDGEFKRIPLNIHGWPNPLVAAPNPEPPAPGQTLISNLDLTRGRPFSLYRGELLAIVIASPFTTGSHDAGYALHGIQIELRDQPIKFVGGIRAAIHNDNDGKPGAFLHELGLQVNLQKGIATFHTPARIVLAGNTTYWLTVSTESMLVSTQQVRVVLTRFDPFDQNDNNVGTNCAARDWSIGNFNYSRITSTVSWNRGGDAIKMAILGERVSDPSVESSEPTCDDLPESTTTTGRLIVDGDGVKGQHQTQGDADWYSVDLMARTNYQFTANPGEKGLPYYTLRILDDDGAEQRNSLITAGSDGAYHGSDRRNVLPFQTDTPGTYFVSIEPRGNSSTVAYTLAMLGDDYPDSSLTRAIVDVSNNGRNFGDFHNYLMRTDANPDSSMTNDIDWIRVDLQGNATYEITYDVACLHEGEIVGIYDSDGHPTYHTGAAFQSDKKIRWCGDIKTKFTAPSDGWYFIAVTARGANFPHRDTNGLHLNKHWNPFTGVHGTLSIKVTTP